MVYLISPPKKLRGHAVSFVTDDKIPFTSSAKQRLQIIAAAQHVESRDQQCALAERVPGARHLYLIAGQDVEGEAEFDRQLILPLPDEASWWDDEAAFEIPADHQLFDDQPGHDGFASAGIVGEQKAQGLRGSISP